MEPQPRRVLDTDVVAIPADSKTLAGRGYICNNCVFGPTKSGGLPCTPLLILNDCHPTYCTSFDDDFLVFDSFNTAVDSTIQESKLQVFGKVLSEFKMENTFIPDLPSKHFPAFKEECKSTAFLRIKEVFDAKSDNHSKKARSFLDREKRRGRNGLRYPNYGRK